MKENKPLLLRYKNFLIRAVVVIMLTFLATRVIFPTIESINTTRSHIADDKQKLLSLSAKEELINSQNRSSMAQQAQKLNEALPSVIDLPLILATLQKVTTDTNVELGDFSLSSNSQILSILAAQQGEKVSSFQFQVALTGTFENLKLFIQKLDTVSPMMRVEGIEFERDSTKASVSFFFQPQSIGKGNKETPLSKLTQSQQSAINQVAALEPPVLEEPLVATPSGESGRQSPFR